MQRTKIELSEIRSIENQNLRIRFLEEKLNIYLFHVLGDGIGAKKVFRNRFDHGVQGKKKKKVTRLFV